MELTDAINHLKESLADPTHKWGCEECKQEHEQLLYWLTEYRAMISERHSDNLSERLAAHLVWAESNSYECPVTLAEDLQEAISTLAKVKRQMQISNEMIVERDCVIDGMENEINRLQSKSSWISCEERMLKETGLLNGYLVSIGDCITIMPFFDGKFREWRDNGKFIVPDPYVEFWMPLPKYPEEELK